QLLRMVPMEARQGQPAIRLARICIADEEKRRRRRVLLHLPAQRAFAQFQRLRPRHVALAGAHVRPCYGQTPHHQGGEESVTIHLPLIIVGGVRAEAALHPRHFRIAGEPTSTSAAAARSWCNGPGWHWSAAGYRPARAATSRLD